MKKKMIFSIALSTLFALILCSAPCAAQSAVPSAQTPLLDPALTLAGSGDIHVETVNDLALVWREGAAPNLLIATAFSPYTANWNVLSIGQPNVLDYGINGGRVGMVGNDRSVWTFCPTTSSWSFQPFAHVTGYDAAGVAALAWNDGDTAMGYSALVDLSALQPLPGTGYKAAIFDKSSAASAILYNSTDAYGYSALTNSWSHQAIGGPPEGQSAGPNTALLWDSAVKYGYSAILNGWVADPAGSSPITGVAGGKIAVAYSTKAADFYDGVNGAWTAGPAYNQNFPPSVRVGNEVALLWASSGAWAFDLDHGTVIDTGITPGVQLSYQGKAKDNALLLWNNNEAWGYYRTAPFVPGAKIALDGTPATAFVHRGGAMIFNASKAYGLGHDCTWAEQPLDTNRTYHGSMRAGAAVVWSDGDAYAFNCRTNAWVPFAAAVPPILGGSASNEHAVVWTADKAYAYDVEDGLIHEIALTGKAVRGGSSMWVTGVFDNGGKIYAFSSETKNWSTQQLPATPLLVQVGGYEIIAATNSKAFGYSSMLGAWSTATLDKRPIGVDIGVTAGTVKTAKALYSYSAFTNTWAKFP